MEFKYFSKVVSKIENLALVGEAAHFKMMPEFRMEEHKKARLVARDTKKAAVLALFYPDSKGQTNFVLILRKTYKGVHSNQIAFPGGKVEKEDINLEATALRETNEEVGIDPNQVHIMKALSSIYIPPSNFEVYPFLALHKEPISFVLQESEVAAVVEVSLNDLVDDATIFEKTLSTSYAENMKVPAFNFNDHTVWGATAMILSEIKELLKKVL